MINFDQSKHKIAIIAPSARAASLEESHANLTSAIQYLESEGFKTQVSQNIFSNTEKTYYHYASSQQERLSQLKDALLDPDIKIIWCFRGGSGASEIVHELANLNLQCPTEKAFIGFSDATSILTYCTQMLNIPSIHGASLSQIVSNPSIVKDMVSYIFGSEVVINLKPINNKATLITSPIITIASGGNLGIIQSLVGTNLHPNFDNKLLTLEDINEFPFQIKRTLVHLFEAKVINHNMTGIIFGQFDTKYQNYSLKNMEAIQDFVDEYIKDSIPCFTTTEFGHSDIINKPILFNSEVALHSNYMKCEGIFDIMKGKSN